VAEVERAGPTFVARTAGVAIRIDNYALANSPAIDTFSETAYSCAELVTEDDGRTK
jgi:hypothetical protein